MVKKLLVLVLLAVNFFLYQPCFSETPGLLSGVFGHAVLIENMMGNAEKAIKQILFKLREKEYLRTEATGVRG